jgi:signal transduction histidine kinase/CheY-like chemotaxis protein
MDPAASNQPERPAHDVRAERLARDLAEAIGRQYATSEVLEAMGRSSVDLAPVFEAVVRHAVQLCRADAGQLFELQGEVFRPAVLIGGSEEYRRFLEAHPIERGPGSMVGLVDRDRRAVQIADAKTDPRYTWSEAQELGGFRTILGVPMLAADHIVGVIALWRKKVEPFDDRTLGVVAAFAAQAAIAIQNVQLLHQLRQRTDELARSVDELRALAEVSRVVSSTLDVQEVLTTIVTHAVELSGTDGGSIFEFDGQTGRFVLRACFGTSERLAEALREIDIPLGETFVGRAAVAGEVREAPDLDREPPDPHIDELLRHGWRSMVAVPLRKEGEIVGTLVVRSKRPGAVPAHIFALLEAFASQSAVAIHNARVFRELENKTAELEIAGRHKTEFLASMSHELRTPLNAVIGFSDVLLDRMFGELNERQEEYVGDIRDSGRHLLDLINEILDLSKIEAGRMELELSEVALGDLLTHVVAMVRERAEGHGIALTLDVAPDVGTLDADELKLKQVALNLLSNAVKFTPDGGSVSLTARTVGDEVQVSVTDTGPGVAEEDQERIFEAFQRGDRAARNSAEGTGLGLTLSRRIVDMHHGRLMVDSRPGKGSTFSFAIPVRPTLEPSPKPGAPDGPPVTAQTVLVVEDDRPSADLLRVYLEDAGYRVAVARDGAEGLKWARELVPTALILDIGLPGLDGWQLLARLKSDPATACIPVVVASMLDAPGAGFALGAAEYLVKPVGQDELLDALARCVPRRSRRTVVAIDDEPRDLDLVEAVLSADGWTVARAAGGAEGVALVQRDRPAVVLLDLLMPDVDGFEVVERLRSDPEVADVPIVVLTSKDMTRADRERLDGRVSFLAQKGTFRQAELLALVERLAGAGAAGVQGAP